MIKCPHCSEECDENESHCFNCFHELGSESSANTASIDSQTVRNESDAPEPAAVKPVVPVPEPRAEEVFTKPSPSAAAKPTRAERPSEAISQPPSNTGAGKDKASRFTPLQRPPMAVLRIFDDNGKDFEAVRIREGKLTIGRKDGDVLIPHDPMMSGKHCSIACKLVDDSHRWYIVDHESTNGTFLCVNSMRLEHNSEIMIGAYRYRFDAPRRSTNVAPDPQPADAPMRTMGWKPASLDEAPTETIATLVRITPEGETDQFAINSSDSVIGCDPQSDVLIRDDRFVSNSHARIYRDEHSRWFIDDLGSRNGSWVKVTKKRLDMNCYFQCGEQKFSIRF